jgi:hypothetical protein
MRCLNGEIFARLVVTKPEHEERCRAMGITDFRRIYTSKDLASGEDLIFAATGVRRSLDARRALFGDGIRTRLSHHAERPAPDQVHRLHSRRTRPERQNTFLMGQTAPRGPRRRREACREAGGRTSGP